jgi:hypothetical protein
MGTNSHETLRRSDMGPRSDSLRNSGTDLRGEGIIFNGAASNWKEIS